MKKMFEINKKLTYSITFIIFLLYEIMYATQIARNVIFNYILAYVCACMLIISVAYWIKEAKSKSVLIFSVINFIIFVLAFYIIYKLTGKIMDTNYMKYPFRTYYLSYAFAISTILIVILRNKKIERLLSKSCVMFISKHSLWMYLWHILFLKIIGMECFDRSITWILKFVVILIGAFIITWIQDIIIKKLKSKGINLELLKIFEG